MGVENLSGSQLADKLTGSLDTKRLLGLGKADKLTANAITVDLQRFAVQLHHNYMAH